ncbi:MAG: hypothetical protein Q9173_004334 [Seirophora scorigena]
MAATMPRLLGMGVPSKYLDLPVLSLGREETVTLKRARRVRPQRTKKARRRVSSGVRRPSAKAAEAGATPKEICIAVKRQEVGGKKAFFRDAGERKRRRTYEISQGIEFLAHQAALLPPARDLAVHEVEEEAEGHEGESEPHGAVGLGGAKAIPHREKDGHEAAEAWMV